MLRDVFVPSHFRAILYRRVLLLRRYWLSFLITCLMTLVFSGAAVLIDFLMKTMVQDITDPVTFKTFYPMSNNYYIIQEPAAVSWSTPIIAKLAEMYKNDTGTDINITYFDNRTYMNEVMYTTKVNNGDPKYVKGGVMFRGNGLLPNTVTFINRSIGTRHAYQQDIQLTRALWKLAFGDQNDFRFCDTKLLRKLTDYVFGFLAPLLIVCGLISVIPTIISQPITDNTGEVRSYMVSSSLTLLPYWLATYFLDMILWCVISTLVWAIFIAFRIKTFLDNMLSIWYLFILSGFGFVMFVYVISFMFSNAESASRNAFMINVLLLILPMVINLIWVDTTVPVYMEWIYAAFPTIGLQRLLENIMILINAFRQPLSYFFNNSSTRPGLIMQFINPFLYGFILFVIEKSRDRIGRAFTERDFAKYADFFKEEKKTHPSSPETQAMKEAVETESGFAVKVSGVSRLFFNTAGEPIPAVNDVSLGVKTGSVFGFLGANGAGKTTLIKMITSMLPPSAGTIEVDGADISKHRDTTKISICPQFNTHLCLEMSPAEHFKLYKMIFRMSDADAEERQDFLFKILELDKYKNKLVKEMSGGQQRKLAVALSFYGPAEIILLDEPTSSLDPYARHTVHELINQYKGHKTFMLCTHMLGEAEALCDTISIMVRGSVYTVGTPQYLSSKFGTEYKVEVLFKENSDAVSRFFEEYLPYADLTITRPTARIYTIPSEDLTLPTLFELLEKGRTEFQAFYYYTCSSSSLERVFMEIVKLSETEAQFAIKESL